MLRGIGASIAAIIVATNTVGCARDLSQYRHRQRTSAPQSEVQTGVVVRGATGSDVAEILDRHPEAQFRVLNLQHQMYEILGVPQGELQSELPSAHVSQNQFFTTLQPTNKLSFRAMVEQAAGDQVSECEEPEGEGPKAVLKSENLTAEIEAKAIPRNAVVKLNGLESQNTVGARKPLKMAFVILRPKGSLGEEQELVNAQSVEVKTDSMGGYGVGLIVQDENNVCNLDIIEFGVTDNVTFSGPNPQPIGEVDLSKITHLKGLHAQESWGKSQGAGQIVAIIDTGVNYNHLLLRDNVLTNSKEIPDNKIDDDQNGFVDDVSGWDFANTDALAYDDVGHGSHVAGLAASSVMGMAKSAKILAVKVLGTFGGDTGAVAAGVRYAVDRGAKILNLSLGSYTGPNPELMSAIAYAESKGALVVAASGNGHPVTGVGLDTDVVPNFPSSLENANILSVASIAVNNELAIYSNYGLKSVDVAAPGGDESELIVSAYMENPANIALIMMAGTSMAAPIVSGIAAQVWAQNPTLKYSAVKSTIMNSGSPVPALTKTVVSGRKVDALAAVSFMSPVALH